MAPPPVVAGFRVVEYAVIRQPVVFRGRSDLVAVGPNEEAKEVGPVPRLAIGQSLRDTREFALLHCTRTWEVLGIQGGFDTVRQVKRRAERTYARLSDAWVRTDVTIRQAKDFEHAVWHGMKCSFCGRIPPEQDVPAAATVVSSKNASICGACICEFYEAIVGEHS